MLAISPAEDYFPENSGKRQSNSLLFEQENDMSVIFTLGFYCYYNCRYSLHL
jgi:hypothetical protein